MPTTPDPGPPAAPARLADRALHLLLLVGAFVPLGLGRFIDGDEGYYLYAARLVGEGHAPYRDFFYPQMPLLPYVYALWFRIVGVSWVAGRALSIALAVSLGLLVGEVVRRRTGSARLALLAVALYATSSLALGWFTVAKTYALSTLLLFAAYALLGVRANGRARFASGVLLGLAIDARLLALAALPAFLFALGNEERPRTPARLAAAWGAFVGGCAVALAPLLWFVQTARAQFAFDNLGYHAIRSDLRAGHVLTQKVSTALSLLGVRYPDGLVGVQLDLLLVLVVAAVAARVGKARQDAALWVALSIGVVSFLPTPTFVQYFCVALPFLVVLAALGVAEPARPRRLAALTPFVVAGCLLVAPFEAWRYAVDGRDVPGLLDRADAVNWRIGTVNAMAHRIDDANPRRVPVVTWWPGYLLESASPVVPGLENHFGPPVARKLDTASRARQHLVDADDIFAELAHDRGPAVVGNYAVPRESIEVRLATLGYARAGGVDSAEVDTSVARPN